MQYIDFFYNYILPTATLLSFGFIGYLLISKREDYEKIEESFHKSIEKNIELSDEAIKTHYENMQHFTKQKLEQLDKEARERLISVLNMLENVNKKQDTLNYQLDKLQKHNEELSNLIIKRDTKIRILTKKLQRMKDGV